MKSILRCFYAELLKTKRTLALLLCAVAPLLIGIFMVAMYLRDADYFMKRAGLNPWDQFTEMGLVYWTLLLVPLFIPLVTALLAQFEHNRHNWKLIYTLPNPRWATFFAKWLVTQGLMLLCFTELVLIIFTSGKLLNLINPGYGFSETFPIGNTIKFAGIAYLACWILISIHTWIGMRFSSFPLALGIGIFATVGALFIFGQDVSYYYPWTMPGLTIIDTRDGVLHFLHMILGCLGGLIFTIPAAYNLSHREIG